MQAGRELDALVAEKVMGWIGPIVWIEDEMGCDPYMFPPGVIVSERDNDRMVPVYSTGIAAAWMVVDRMEERGWMARISREMGSWNCRFVRPEDTAGYVFDEDATAPLAICLAALRAVGMEVPE